MRKLIFLVLANIYIQHSLAQYTHSSYNNSAHTVSYSLDGKYVATSGIAKVSDYDKVFTEISYKVWEIATGNLVFTAYTEADIATMGTKYGCRFENRNIQLNNNTLNIPYRNIAVYEPTTGNGVALGRDFSGKFIFAKCQNTNWTIVENGKLKNDAASFLTSLIDDQYETNTKNYTFKGNNNYLSPDGNILVTVVDNLSYNTKFNGIWIFDLTKAKLKTFSASENFVPNSQNVEISLIENIVFSTDGKQCFVNIDAGKGRRFYHTIDVASRKITEKNEKTILPIDEKEEKLFHLPDPNSILILPVHAALHQQKYIDIMSLKKTEAEGRRSYLSKFGKLQNIKIYNKSANKTIDLIDDMHNLLLESVTAKTSSTAENESNESIAKRTIDEINGKFEYDFITLAIKTIDWLKNPYMHEASFYSKNVNPIATTDFDKSKQNYFIIGGTKHKRVLLVYGNNIDDVACLFDVSAADAKNYKIQIRYFDKLDVKINEKMKLYRPNFKAFQLNIEGNAGGGIMVQSILGSDVRVIEYRSRE